MNEEQSKITIENEKSLLSFCLTEHKICEEIFRELKPEDFFDFKNRTIAQSIENLLKQNIPIDIVQIILDLKKTNSILECPEIYISDIVSYSSRISNWKWYLKEVKRLSLERLKEVIAKRIKQQDNNERDIKLLTKIQNKIDELSLKDVDLADYCEYLKKEITSEKQIIKTGFFGLDKSSMSSGDLVVIAARPGVGKSILIANMINNFLRKGLKCLVYTTEMTQEQYLLRQVCIEYNLFFYGLRNGYADEEQRKEALKNIDNFLEKYKGLLMYSPILRPTSDDIIREIENFKPDVLVIDNMSSIKLTSKMTNKADKIGEYLEEVKESIVKNKILALIVCHINREAEKGGGYQSNKDTFNKNIQKEPNLYNLKDSSKIEELANKAILMWDEGEDVSDTNRVLICWKYAKDRDGIGGRGKFILDRDTLAMASTLD